MPEPVLSDPRLAGAILTIDLDAVVANYRRVRERFSGATLGAVVKADAYGLGAERVAPALAAAGCRVFFVAHIEEGIALRPVLPKAEIHVLNGLMPGSTEAYAEHRLAPVLNSLEEIEAWGKFVRNGSKQGLLCDIHLDTGMNRLGLETAAVETLSAAPQKLAGLDIAYFVSHLACADEPEHPMNREQRMRFAELRHRLPPAPASLANSSGIFLGPDYHFDLGRPGACLYGLNPTPGAPNPMTQVVRLQGRILQVRQIDRVGTVGYGATHRAARGGRIATVAIGYADGYLRSFSNAGYGCVGGVRVPLVGRVSMDLITLDVTDAPGALVRPGALVDIIGPGNAVDDIAAAAGTIGYEILTGLGRRYHRIYIGG